MGNQMSAVWLVKLDGDLWPAAHSQWAPYFFCLEVNGLPRSQQVKWAASGFPPWGQSPSQWAWCTEEVRVQRRCEAGLL